MATSPIKGAGFGALGGMAMRLGLKAALTMLLNTKHIMDYLAAEVYRDETGKEFDKLPVLEKTLWCNRVQSVIRAAMNTV
jgi:hypothetical protein